MRAEVSAKLSAIVQLSSPLLHYSMEMIIKAIQLVTDGQRREFLLSMVADAGIFFLNSFVRTLR